ncbi:MAG: histone deacetylase [Armatimonadota bacterium]|nr:histone deacetylase [Armatimonadota bacterium]
MITLHVTHPACERHAPGLGHPERPERLRAVLRAIDESGLTDQVRTVEAPAVDERLLAAVHDGAYVARIEALARQGGGWLDPDTRVGPDSAVAAMHAAGAAQRAAEALCAGQAMRAFVTVRPPGHHALPDRGMGFCLFNNAALAAVAARHAGRQRVMIVDWDVHHGNGTQAVFWRDPSVLVVSLHQEFWYPGTGAVDEIGEGAGEGFTVNVPLPAETGNAGYEAAFAGVVLPLVSAFGPDFVVISAGYDGHFADPLGGMVLTARGYGRLARLLDDAVRPRETPVLAVLEGGYDLDALGASVVATLEVLTEHTAWIAPDEDVPAEVPAALVQARIRDVQERLRPFWRL